MRRNGTREEWFNEKVWRLSKKKCWEWLAATDPNGYGRFGVADGRHVLAHRFAWIVENGPIPSGMNVLHRCDNPSCCNPNHLFLGTQKDNVDDAMSKGRHSRPPYYSGEAHPRAKLTFAQCVAMRAEYARGGTTQRKLGKKYGLSQPCVGKIIRQETMVLK